MKQRNSFGSERVKRLSSSFVVSYAAVQSGKRPARTEKRYLQKVLDATEIQVGEGETKSPGPRGFSTLLRNSLGQSEKSHDFVSDFVSFRFFSFPFLSPCIFPCAPSLPPSRHPSLLHPQTYFPFTLPHQATAASSSRPISPRYLVSVENQREDKRFRWQV